MKKLTAIIVLVFCFSLSANAGVWKWVDAHGKTHFVDSNTAIYTWADEYAKVYYSGKLEHESAVRVKLVWHSTGGLSDSGPTEGQSGTSQGIEIDPNEIVEERRERGMAEAYYCKRAIQIHDLYVNAPRQYKTNEAGEREYLSDEEAAATLAETEARVAELCDLMIRIKDR